ncbi:MAG: DUF371 domain-containing protein [Methanomicrobiales archaeon]|jgi:hypothetical protein|nr:DUF371 domain-containing protein [Methanomicrobiales archaeon]
MMRICEEIDAKGHPLVSATHKTTFEITKEPHLTAAGDCIIGVAASKGISDLSNEFQSSLAHDDAILKTTLICEEYEVVVMSQGSSQLSFTHATDLVWRRSRFVCERTIGIQSDMTALLLPRDLISALKQGARLSISLEVVQQ